MAERLRPRDLALLAEEAPSSPMHNATVEVFEPGESGFDYPSLVDLIGDRIGKVPPSIPRTPLQEDFHRCVRSARLTRALETPGKVQLDLDQRKPTNHLASVLLHRLILLDLPWGKLHVRGDRAKGRSRESWTLQWKHIYGMRLLEAGLWGLTLRDASHAYALHRALETERMAEIADRIHRCLKAELPRTAWTIK